MMNCFSQFMTVEILNCIGFICNGIGAMFFFFINSFIVKTTINTDAFEKYLSHTISIKNYWMKNISNKEKDLFVEYQEKCELPDKSDWGILKKFAFWAVSQGSSWSFIFIVIGSILQLIAKFMV